VTLSFAATMVWSKRIVMAYRQLAGIASEAR
jgi:hypothetical protein